MGEGKLKILFLDNSKTTRAAMSMILKSKGHEVTALATGQEAIDRLKVEDFDIALMDLYMPFMNGHEAAKLVRALPDKGKDVPIVALTASDDPRDMDVAKDAGMNEFVVKSEDHKALFEVLDKYVEKLGKK